MDFCWSVSEIGHQIENKKWSFKEQRAITPTCHKQSGKIVHEIDPPVITNIHMKFKLNVSIGYRDIGKKVNF